jgi:quercetin dioxygenase-like cupin family protein
MRVESIEGQIPSKTLLQLIRPGEFRSILFINQHRYGPGEVHEEHEHLDREEIFICLKGSGFTTGASREVISRGSILVVGPGERHGFISDGSDPLEYLCIGCRLPEV